MTKSDDHYVLVASPGPSLARWGFHELVRADGRGPSQYGAIFRQRRRRGEILKFQFARPCCTVAVNRAIEWIPAEYWCMGDWQALKLFQPFRGHKPTLIVAPRIERKRHRPEILPYLDHDRIRWESLEAPAKTMARKDTTSGVAAIAAAVTIARQRGASIVRVIGMDLNGNEDFAGVRGKGRSEGRWEKERERVRALVEWADELGVSVRLLSPDSLEL